MPNYSDINYWEARYSEQKEFTFDWCEDYEALKPLIEQLISMTTKSESGPNILMLGCGNSELSEKIYQDNICKRIFNIDTSNNAIKYMKERCKSMEEMSWEVMDCRELKFAPSFFDLVIDKCTLDTILCGEKAFVNAAIVTKEVQKVLKTGGIYMIVSYGDPTSRLLHLNREHLGLDVTIQCVKKEYAAEDELFPKTIQEKISYIYLCKKNSNADNLCQENFPRVYFELEKGESIEDYEDDFTEGENKISQQIA